MSFRIPVSSKQQNAARFIGDVRDKLLNATLEAKETHKLSQQKIAERIGVNRSVLNRQLNGSENLTLRTVADICWALEKLPVFEIVDRQILGERSNQAAFASGPNAVIDDHSDFDTDWVNGSGGDALSSEFSGVIVVENRSSRS